MSYKVKEYLRDDGTSPYEEWFMGLDTLAAAKVTIVKLKMEQGNLSNENGLEELENIGWIGVRVIGSTSARTVRD